MHGVCVLMTDHFVFNFRSRFCAPADTVAPSATYCVMSDNAASTTTANLGDTITVTVTASEAIRIPTVTCGTYSFSAGPQADGLLIYVMSHVVVAGDAEGTVGTCTVSYTDVSGNAGTATLSASQNCSTTIGE